MNDEELIRQILESQQEMARNLQEIDKNQQEMAKSLQEMDKTQEKIFSELNELKQGQAETNQRLDKFETETNRRFDKLETETTRISQSVATIEVEHGQYLRALGEGYALVFDKLEPLPNAVQDLQDDVSVIKAVVTSHSKDINILKAAN